MIGASIYEAPRLGCAECGYYTENLRLVEVHLLTHTVTLCPGCATKLKDKLRYVLVTLAKEKEGGYAGD